MNRSRRSLLILLVILVILILGILCRTSCCKLLCGRNGYLPQDTSLYVKTISWNILFKDNVSFLQKEKVIENIEKTVGKFYLLYNEAYGTYFNPKFEPTVWCPCDSALFTIRFTCVDGNGKSVSSPPPTTGILPSGAREDVLAISDNMEINEPTRSFKDSIPTDSVPNYVTINKEYNRLKNIKNNYLRLYPGMLKNAVNVKDIPIDFTKILAIIDTGIDTALFTTPIQHLIWKAPPGEPTLFNFIPHQPVSDLFDSGSTKHGSAVTGIAIEAMNNSAFYPRLMVLKALDKNDRGSTFSVSCALSYAIKNHATVVNASLGYMGKEDSVLKHYIELCAKHRPFAIQLFVSAGNTRGHHDDALICSTNFPNNILTADSLFYPGCFSDKFDNITTVTQISKPDTYCYYQYFSNYYVTLGVLNSNLCCSFDVGFLTRNNFYEGSSFATPFASGLKMSTIIATGNRGLTNSTWDGLLKTDPSEKVTLKGKYIVHN